MTKVHRVMREAFINWLRNLFSDWLRGGVGRVVYMPLSAVDQWYQCGCGNKLVICPGFPDFVRGFSICRQCQNTWDVGKIWPHGDRPAGGYRVEFLGRTTLALQAAAGGH